jgi:transcriptional regulator with XRE-family HTH domain
MWASRMAYKKLTNLIALRKDKKVTQEEMAKSFGVTRVTYARWESGMAKPSIDYIEKMADFFGVSVDYILGRK